MNVSKSGVSVSSGVKGLSVSSGPRGNYLNAGLNGVYYRTRLNSKKSLQAASNLLTSVVSNIRRYLPNLLV